MNQEEASTTDACLKGPPKIVHQVSDLVRKDMKHFQTIPKRGEKDFEPDGTNKQQRILQEGREAMYAALSFEAGLYHVPYTPFPLESFNSLLTRLKLTIVGKVVLLQGSGSKNIPCPISLNRFSRDLGFTIPVSARRLDNGFCLKKHY